VRAKFYLAPPGKPKRELVVSCCLTVEASGHVDDQGSLRVKVKVFDLLEMHFRESVSTTVGVCVL